MSVLLDFVVCMGKLSLIRRPWARMAEQLRSDADKGNVTPVNHPVFGYFLYFLKFI